MRQVIIDGTTANINSLQVITISEVATGSLWKVICNDGIEFETSDANFIANVKIDIDKASTGGFEIIVLTPEQVGPGGVPIVENPKTNAIYLAPKTQGSKNVFVEWIYVNNDWEKIGETSIDLSDYYKKSETYSKTEADALLGNKADKATSLSGYGITDAKIENNTITLGSNTITPLTEHQSLTDYVKKVNNVGPDTSGNVNVTTFSAVPSSMDSYKTGTLENYCKEFLTKVNPSQGSAYLTSGIGFSNLPKSFSDHGTPGCEMFIYVPMRSGNNIVYNLEITTTNCFEEQWYGGSGKWMAICQVENGVANLHMPWQGMLGCPQQDSTVSGKHKYIPIEDYHAVSKYYLDQQLRTKQNTLTAGTGISIENNVISSTGGIDIIDDLTTARADAALSANQGKVLNDTKANKATTLSGYGITDSVVTSVNGYMPVAGGGSITIPTNGKFPSDMYSGEDMHFDTLALMCKYLYEKHDGSDGSIDKVAIPGACFQGKLWTTDSHPVTSVGTDMILQVIKNGLYHVDMYSTNDKDGYNHWHAFYFYQWNPSPQKDGLNVPITGVVCDDKLTSSLSTKANSSDVYTKTAIDTRFDGKSIKVVSSLPTTPDDNIIYFVTD